MRAALSKALVAGDAAKLPSVAVVLPLGVVLLSAWMWSRTIASPAGTGAGALPRYLLGVSPGSRPLLGPGAVENSCRLAALVLLALLLAAMSGGRMGCPASGLGTRTAAAPHSSPDSVIPSSSSSTSASGPRCLRWLALPSRQAAAAPPCALRCSLVAMVPQRRVVSPRGGRRGLRHSAERRHRGNGEEPLCLPPCLATPSARLCDAH